MIRVPCNPKNAGKLYFTAAPTRPQVKKIYWKDYKALIPRSFYDSKMVKISESELTITIRWDSVDTSMWTELHLLSMDVPERFEGPMWAGGGIDEIAVLPAMETGDFIKILQSQGSTLLR